MREGLYVLDIDGETTGITPAYAGRTTIDQLTAYWIWDHPRLCGKDTGWKEVTE